jgi:osmotically-inducible protein OsmY
MNAVRVRAAVAALALVASVAAAAAAADATDAEIKGKIEQRLSKEGLDERSEIAVEVEQGVARLSGFTLRYVDAREAERLARKEARAVVNLLRVVPESPRSDRAIQGDAQTRVRHWERYGAFDAVAVQVHEGVVRLQGWVDTPVKRDEIEGRLAEVDGVRDVHNDLRLQGFSQGDERLRLEIYRRIYADPMFEQYRSRPDPPIRIFVDRNRVTLAGSVTSQVEVATVGAIARGTLAFSVDNQVQVERATPAEDRKKDPSES